VEGQASTDPDFVLYHAQSAAMSPRDTQRQLVDLLPRLRRFALVLARTTDAADDLVQSALERALGRLDQWEPGTRLDRWMFQIMKTVWLNNRRAAALRQVENIDDHIDDHVVDGAREMEAKLTLAEVRQAFDRLSAEQRQALFLVSIEGYTYSEAAKLLDVPIGTVISRLARGRAALMVEASNTANNVTLLRHKDKGSSP
jgi:RNA polymerase sigma factor (sigma-70 family)